MSDPETDRDLPLAMPSAERIANQLRGVKSVDEFFGRAGVLACLFARTLEEMPEPELTQHLGHERYAPEGRNSGISRNGHNGKKVLTSAGEPMIAVPRNRTGEFSPQFVQRYAHNSNELEEQIIGMYAKGMSVRDIEEAFEELYGVSVSAAKAGGIQRFCDPDAGCGVVHPKRSS